MGTAVAWVVPVIDLRCVVCVCVLQNYEGEDIRLAQNYFSDRKGAKLTKSKLQVTSALMLPLRRLLLIGTEDGLVRVVS